MGEMGHIRLLKTDLVSVFIFLSFDALLDCFIVQKNITLQCGGGFRHDRYVLFISTLHC